MLFSFVYIPDRIYHQRVGRIKLIFVTLDIMHNMCL